MATSALDLINDASLMAGTIGHGESLSADESAYGLRQLNSMIEGWSIAPLSCFNISQMTIPVVAGTAAYSTNLGTPAVRPNSVDSVFLRYGTIDYPCEPITAERYSTIQLKTVPSIPEYYVFTGNYPDATFTFFPTPFASMTAYIGYMEQLQSFAALTTQVALPPGFLDAIVSNLAVRLSVGKQIHEWVARLAIDSLAAIKRQNVQASELTTDLPIGPRRFNIYSGT